MKVAILVKNHTNQLKEVGDINARALYNNLKKKTDLQVELVYLNKAPKAPAFGIPISKALFHQYDKIYASSPKRLFGPPCIIFALLHLKPLYFSIFGSTLAPVSENEFGKNLFVLLCQLKIIKPIATSRHQRQFYKRHFKINIPVLLPCLISFGYNSVHKRKPPPTLLFVGSGKNEGRGVEIIIQVATKLLKKYPDLELRILNKFKETKRTKNLVKLAKISKNTKFVSFQKDMAKEYKKAWVNVIPFKRTRFIPPIPFSFIEAMSFSVPTITTKKAQFREIIPEKNLIPRNDVNKLVARIDEILQTKKHSEIPKKYFPEEVAKEFLKILTVPGDDP